MHVYVYVYMCVHSCKEFVLLNSVWASISKQCSCDLMLALLMIFQRKLFSFWFCFGHQQFVYVLQTSNIRFCSVWQCMSFEWSVFVIVYGYVYVCVFNVTNQFYSFYMWTIFKIIFHRLLLIFVQMPECMTDLLALVCDYHLSLSLTSLIF